MGLIKLRENELVYMENWNWEIDASKKVEQEIAKKLLKYEDSVHWMQKKLDNQELKNWSKNQERRPSVVNHLMSEIQKLQNKANSLTDEREFNEFESSSSGSSHVPTRPLTIPSRSEKRSREPTMPNDTRNAMCISGNVCECPTCSRRTIHTSLRKFEELGMIFLRNETRK